MPREFITEREVEDMFKRGITSIELNDHLVLTELAYEKAQRLGVTLISPNLKPPAAPERPYLSKPVEVTSHKTAGAQSTETGLGIRTRIKEAVSKKLGDKVDPALLDSIITRVLDQLDRK